MSPTRQNDYAPRLASGSENRPESRPIYLAAARAPSIGPRVVVSPVAQVLVYPGSRPTRLLASEEPIMSGAAEGAVLEPNPL